MTDHRTFRMLRRAGLGASALLLVYTLWMGVGGGWGIRPLAFRLDRQGLGPFLFAHRGVAVGLPENSAASLHEAVRSGYRAAEIDVRRTADGHLVVFHDGDTRRLLGVEGNIQDLDLAALRRHPLLVDGRLSESRILTLHEALDTFGGVLAFYLDVKVPSMEVGEALAEAILSRGLEGSCLVASADPLFLFRLRWAYPRLQTVLEGFDAGKEWLYHLMPERVKPDLYSGNVGKVDSRHMGRMHSMGLADRRIVYGVDSSNLHLVTEHDIPIVILDHDPTNAVIRSWLRPMLR